MALEKTDNKPLVGVVDFHFEFGQMPKCFLGCRLTDSESLGSHMPEDASRLFTKPTTQSAGYHATTAHVSSSLMAQHLEGMAGLGNAAIVLG
jgi:hypothetical protein